MVIRTTYSHIIMVVRAALDRLIISNAESIIASTERYLIIKKTLFTFRKKFATTESRKKYGGYKKIKKSPQH